VVVTVAVDPAPTVVVTVAPPPTVVVLVTVPPLTVVVDVTEEVTVVAPATCCRFSATRSPGTAKYLHIFELANDVEYIVQEKPFRSGCEILRDEFAGDSQL